MNGVERQHYPDIDDITQKCLIFKVTLKIIIELYIIFFKSVNKKDKLFFKAYWSASALATIAVLKLYYLNILRIKPCMDSDTLQSFLHYYL